MITYKYMYTNTYMYIYIYTYTHIHTFIYIYIYIYNMILRPANSWSRMLKCANFLPRHFKVLIRDPLRSSSFFHWCPWIRDISYRKPFGEKHNILDKKVVHGRPGELAFSFPTRLSCKGVYMRTYIYIYIYMIIQ